MMAKLAAPGGIVHARAKEAVAVPALVTVTGTVPLALVLIGPAGRLTGDNGPTVGALGPVVPVQVITWDAGLADPPAPPLWVMVRVWTTGVVDVALQPIVKAWLAPCAMFTGAAGVIDRTPDRPDIALKVRLVAPVGPELVTVNVAFVAPPPIGSTRFTGVPAAGVDEYCGGGAGGGRPIVKFGAVQT